MTEADYRAAMRVAVWMPAVCMAPLVVLQHFSPPGARINSQVDSDEDDVFVVIAGVVRTTGTFSFTAGYTTFLALVRAAGARGRRRAQAQRPPDAVRGGAVRRLRGLEHW